MFLSRFLDRVTKFQSRKRKKILLQKPSIATSDMDTAHNKVVVYVRVRPYAYDCEVDFDNGKAVKDGVKCIIQLRKVNTPEAGQKDSGGKTNQATLPNTVRVKTMR